MFEAIQSKHPVYCQNTLQYYKEKYSKIIFAFHSSDDFFEKLDEIILNANEVIDTDFDEILMEYSDVTFSVQLEEIFRGQ